MLGAFCGPWPACRGGTDFGDQQVSWQLFFWQSVENPEMIFQTHTDGRDLDFQMEASLSLLWTEVCRKLEITVKTGGGLSGKKTHLQILETGVRTSGTDRLCPFISAN